jgi:hypothetical protein
MDPFLYGERFLAELENPPVFEAIAAEWLEELSKRPYWSDKEPDGRRISWRLAAAAFAKMKADFRRRGIYMFGASPLVPRYVGETGKGIRTFETRIFGRYMTKGGESRAKVLPQLLLAEKYEAAIKEHGFAAFPDQLLKDWQQAFPKSKTPVLLLAAVDFVEHGLDGMWFTLLPLDDRSLRRVLEKRLTETVNKWNAAHGYKPLCSGDHGYEFRSHLDGARPR